MLAEELLVEIISDLTTIISLGTSPEKIQEKYKQKLAQLWSEEEDETN